MESQRTCRLGQLALLLIAQKYEYHFEWLFVSMLALCYTDILPRQYPTFCPKSDFSSVSPQPLQDKWGRIVHCCGFFYLQLIY